MEIDGKDAAVSRSDLCAQLGDKEACSEIWWETFLGDAREFAENIPEGFSQMAKKAWDDGGKISKNVPAGPFRGFSHLVNSLGSVVWQTADGLVHGGVNVYKMVSENWSNPDPEARAHTCFAGLAFTASLIPFMRGFKMKVPIPKAGPPLPQLVFATGVSNASMASSVGMRSAFVSMRPPPFAFLLKDGEGDELAPQKPAGGASKNSAQSLEAEAADLTRKRAEFLKNNPALDKAIKENKGRVTPEMKASFKDSIVELEGMTRKLHDVRLRYNSEMLRSDAVMNLMAGESVGGNAGSGNVAFNAWVDVDSGLIKRLGNPQNIFPLSKEGLPSVPANLKSASFVVEIKSGKVVNVLGDSQTVVERMRQHVGHRIFAGSDNLSALAAQKIKGRVVTTKGGWQVVPGGKEAGGNKLVAIKKQSVIELGPMSEPKIVSEPDIRMLKGQGAAPVVRGIYVDGKLAGRVAYGSTGKEIVLENISLMKRHDGVGSAVLAHLTEGAAESGMSLRVHYVMNPKGIIGMIRKAGYDAVAVTPKGMEWISKMDPDAYAFLDDIIVMR